MGAKRTLTIACAMVAAARMLFPQVSQAAPPRDLLAAYKKEFAFLEAQKQALKGRLRALEAANRLRVARAEKAVNALQIRLIGLQGSADQNERDLRSAERQLPAEDEGDRLGDTLDRARESLAKYGITIKKAPKKDVMAQLDSLEQAFAKIGPLMRDLGRVRVEKGAFFLANGKRATGTLVRIGAVATYGVASSGEAGALAPAGDGRLKLWPTPAAKDATAFAAGKRPDPFNVFLYESLQKNVDPKKEKTVLEFVEAGGLIGWVIVCLGAVAALMIALRFLILAFAGLRGRAVGVKLERLLLDGKREQAAALCRAAGGSLGRVLRATTEGLQLARQALEDRVSESILREQPHLSRFGAAITVFAAVAPLLGLLGTVTGMISTFDIITEHGTGDPKLLSSGISEALITTELGLIVAIPTLLVGTLLNGWSSGIERSLERSALKVVNADARFMQSGRPRTPAELTKRNGDVVPGVAFAGPVAPTKEPRPSNEEAS